jgi:hypothetical protein
MIGFLNKCSEIQQSGNGNYSINTILTYYEYYSKYRAYITMGCSKMEAYEYTADCSGICSRVVMTAVKLFNDLN